MHAHRSLGLASFSVIAYVCSIVAGCSNGRDEPATATEVPQVVRYIPGGDVHTVSRLAHLMREMTAFSDSTGKRLSVNGDLLPYPNDFKEILTAESTPGMVDRRTFDPFAFAWLHQLDSLYAAPMADRSEVFNGLVQRCANCHGEVCPGPLDRIRKLRIVDPPPSPGH